LLRKKGIGLIYKGLGPCPRILAEKPGDAYLLDYFFRKAYSHGVSLYDVSYINYSHKASDIEETLSKLQFAITSM